MNNNIENPPIPDSEASSQKDSLNKPISQDEYMKRTKENLARVFRRYNELTKPDVKPSFGKKTK